MDVPTVDRLLGSAAKAIARMPERDYEEILRRVEEADNPQALAEAFEGADFGMADEARRAILENVQGDAWRNHKGRFVRMLTQQRMERMAPGS